MRHKFIVFSFFDSQYTPFTLQSRRADEIFERIIYVDALYVCKKLRHSTAQRINLCFWFWSQFLQFQLDDSYCMRERLVTLLLLLLNCRKDKIETFFMSRMRLWWHRSLVGSHVSVYFRIFPSTHKVIQSRFLFNFFCLICSSILNFRLFVASNHSCFYFQDFMRPELM